MSLFQCFSSSARAFKGIPPQLLTLRSRADEGMNRTALNIDHINGAESDR